jgi:hypothetical protein
LVDFLEIAYLPSIFIGAHRHSSVFILRKPTAFACKTARAGRAKPLRME